MKIEVTLMVYIEAVDQKGNRVGRDGAPCSNIMLTWMSNDYYRHPVQITKKIECISTWIMQILSADVKQSDKLTSLEQLEFGYCLPWSLK